MTLIRKYNPGFLTDDELVASFCVRKSQFESIMEMLCECSGSSNPHQIVIGPRGSGKTTLLLRVVAEARRDAELSSRFFPIVFAEESYEVATAGEFWLECLSHLAAQAPIRENDPNLHRTVEDLRTIRDDQELADRCLGRLVDFAHRENKRLVLVVENLNMMFADMTDSHAGWTLRHTLQNEPSIILLGSATSRFDEIDNPDKALYEFFRILTLRPLDTNECAVLWKTASGQSDPPEPEKMRSLEILTGGSPRLLAIIARFGAGLSFRELMADLLDLVDDHTEYFKGHLESLPAQERRVYLGLADLWKPATTKEIADRTRLDTSKCSAQLTRLTERGVVQVAGGSARRKQYYLTERLYNIYYLLRRNRGPDRLIEALIRFMESYYSPQELRSIGIRAARDAEGQDLETLPLYAQMFARLEGLPSLAKDRKELRAAIPSTLSEYFGEYLSPQSAASGTSVTVEGALQPPVAQPTDDAELAAAKALFDKAFALKDQNRPEEAVATYDELVRRFGESESPFLLEPIAGALGNKGCVLDRLNRPEEALAVWNDVLRRFGQSEEPLLLEPVAATFVNKGNVLSKLNRLEEALAASDAVVRRFGENRSPFLSKQVANALVNKGLVLNRLNRSEEALAAWDDVLRRFEQSEEPMLWGPVALAFVNKGNVLVKLNRLEEAPAAYDEVIYRFEENESPSLLGPVALAFANKGNALRKLDRLEEALVAYDEVVRRFGEDESPFLDLVVRALVNKGSVLGNLNRLKEALVTCDEVVRRFGDNESPLFSNPVALALFNKGLSLKRLNQPEEALISYEHALHLWERIEYHMFPAMAEQTILEIAGLELALGRYGSAIKTAGRVLDHYAGAALEYRWQGHLIRARAILASGDQSSYEHDIGILLSILPELDSFPRKMLGELLQLSVDLGPARMRDLIQTSAAADLLLPLTTALEWELGLEPRVAREVEEVAQDVRNELRELQEAQAGDSTEPVHGLNSACGTRDSKGRC